MDTRINQKKIFYLCVVMWLVFSVFFGKTTLQSMCGISSISIYTYGRYFVYLVLLILFLKKEYKQTALIAIFFAATAVCATIIFSGEKVLLSILLLCAVADKVKTKELVKIFLCTHLCIIFLTAVLSGTGIISENVMNRGAVIRNTMGFSHPNALGIEYLIVVFCYFYLRWNKAGCKDYILISLATIIFYKYTDCRTDTLIIIFFLISIILIKSVKVRLKLTLAYWIANFSILVSVGATLFTLFFYDKTSKIMCIADEMFSFRLSKIHICFLEYGLTLVGQRSNIEMIDNSFARVLLINGVFPFLVLVIFCVICARVLYKNKNICMLLIFSGIMLTGFMENIIFRMEYNFVFIVVAGYILSGTGWNTFTMRGLGYAKDINREKL